MECRFDGTYEIEDFEFDYHIYNIDFYNIDYSYTPPEKGSRDKLGPQLEPDWPEELDFIQASANIERHDEEYVGYDLRLQIHEDSAEWERVYNAAVEAYKNEIINMIKEGKNAC